MSPSSSGGIMWTCLMRALERSPHLTQCVRTFTVHIEWDRPPMSAIFSRICFFPFTHLTTLDFTFRGDFEDALAGLRQLVGLSTLVRARIACIFSDSDDFIHIWDPRSSMATIRHVELECWEPRAAVPQGAFLLPAKPPSPSRRCTW
ncbi:hypothetical protein DFH08DRAFT_964326 [Mycena albidolilacea]|uniref:Uncharacterized protein n=1 Tax=Mycena albidolilacea TaxID=1033008 RepID=A0AAD6ZUC9_9AGAR|nr:hypothetical protein DFH08DRAFT_964326 [Mycena albidolilacea]